MKLWTVRDYADGSGPVVRDENDSFVARVSTQKNAQQICDEHNAWQILMERGWTMEQRRDGKWRIATGVYAGIPRGYEDNAHDTPVAAILAAHEWLEEMVKR